MAETHFIQSFIQSLIRHRYKKAIRSRKDPSQFSKGAMRVLVSVGVPRPRAPAPDVEVPPPKVKTSPSAKVRSSPSIRVRTTSKTRSKPKNAG